MLNAKYDATRRRLLITADNDGRAALTAAYDSGGYQRAESEVAEAFHEAYEFVEAADIPGAMTDAPILVESDGIDHPDNGAIILRESAKVFWFPDYMVRDPWEELKNRGRVEFDEAPDSGYPAPAPPTREFIESHFAGGTREGRPIWIGESTFPGADYDAVIKAWPELARDSKYERDSWDCGIYFWDTRGRHGPYGAGVNGWVDAERDGCKFDDCDAAATAQEGLAL